MFKLLLISPVISSVFAKIGLDAFPYTKLDKDIVECYKEQGIEFANLDIGSYFIDAKKNFDADYHYFKV